MTPRLLRTVPALAGVAALGLAGLAPAAAAGRSAADPSTPQVVNRETVQVELENDGSLDVARLFSQLTVVGKGKVEVADPVSTKGLRNLDGFSAPDVKDGKALYSLDVDGTETRRTVSDFDKDLPVGVTVTYTLDGKEISADDLVGKTGDVEAEYTVTNVTGSPTDVTWKDGKGVERTESLTLVTPLVGQLALTLPKTFTELDAPRADGAGDGRGGTLLTWTMVLFEPIGSITQTFAWKGHVEDAVVPPAKIQVVPVPPSRKPELKFGQDGFKDGAAAASELTAGAGLIDANLLKLQEGAGDLLAGLTKLAAGATELSNGLKDKAGPGAAKLAEGAAAAEAGSAELIAGLDDADAGAADLAEGLALILAGVEALPDALAEDPGYQELIGALKGVQAAITTKLVPGINALRSGVSDARAGLEQISAGVTAGGAQIEALLTQLAGHIVAQGGDPTLALQDVQTLGTALTANSTALLAGLAQVIAGLGTTADMTPSTVQGGLNLVKLGLDNPACDLADPTDPANPCGIKQVQGLISGGIATLVEEVSAGLAEVLGEASAGADELSDGLGLLAEGGAQLGDGLGQIADGADELSTGLGDAVTGSSQLADGLNQAKAGGGQIESGAGRLREEGTSALIEGGNETASDAAEHYATLLALNEKAKDGALPYGAPEGATGSAAYEFTLAGADSATQDNTRRAVVALLGFVLAGAVSWMIRRRFAA